MNRRNFLKRAAAVIAGAVAVPTVVKKLSFKPNPAQTEFFGEYRRYSWAQIKGMYNYKDPPESFLNEVSKHPKVSVGAIHCTGDGRVYRYMKNCTTEQLIARALC